MRICFVCDTMESGGAERVIATLSNGFVTRGHDVTILMLSHEANSSFYSLDHRIKLLNLPEKQKAFLKKAKNLKRAILANKPDIVISFLSYVCIYTWWALRRTKIPYVVSERNDPNQRGKIKQYLLNKSFNRASGCVFQTEDAYTWYEKIAKNKSIVIYNPVNLDFVPESCKVRKKQILYVGRFTEQKNCLMLIDAFKLFSIKFPSYTLKMYGNGPMEEAIKQKIVSENLSDKVVMLPSSKMWQKEEYDSSLFLLTSKFEGMPNVLAEALCLGIPSVSTDCIIGGPKELKKLFPNLLALADSNPRSISEKMEEMMLVKSEKCIIPRELDKDIIVEKWIRFIENSLKKESRHV